MGRLQTARLENFIRRWGSIKGPGSVLAETLGEVFPTLDLENLTPENYLPAGWSLVNGFATVTGVAAQLSAVGILNPAGSGQIAVITKIIIQSELGQNLTYGTDLPLMTAVINSLHRDTRQANPRQGNLRITGNANIAAAAGGGFLRAAANVSFEFEAPDGLAVLGPGGQYAVASATVNSNLTVSFFGRVRLAEPSELSF